MVSSSLSLLSPTSFPSISKTDSPSSSIPNKFGIGPFSESSKRRCTFPKRVRLFRCQILGSSSSSNQSRDDASAELFLQNNSIADFMRFKRDGSSAELQTATVSYRKKFPWSILQPFVQVRARILIASIGYLCFLLGVSLICGLWSSIVSRLIWYQRSISQTKSMFTYPVYGVLSRFIISTIFYVFSVFCSQIVGCNLWTRRYDHAI